MINLYLEEITKLKHIKSIDELIDALQEQHIQANLNKQWTQRKHVDMICIKVNPPFLNTTERKKSENIKGLIIPKIKCYYNLQLDNNANIKTSFFPPLPPYSYNLYDLYEQPGSFNRLPNFRTTADQIVTEKRVNIEANCGSKEKFLIELRSMQLRGRIAEFNIPIQQNPNMLQNVSPQNAEMDRTLPSPIYCYERYNCNQCRSNCRFSIEQIQNMGKKAIEEELSAHGHPKSLIINRKRQRNLGESKEELRNHYIRYHTV